MRVNVKDFGAVGDNVADDRPAIQAALDALPKTGGTLWLPRGRFKVSRPLRIWSEDVTVNGPGTIEPR